MADQPAPQPTSIMDTPAASGFIHALGGLVIAVLTGRGVLSAGEGGVLEPIVEGALAASFTLGITVYALWQKRRAANLTQLVGQHAASDASQPGVLPFSPNSPAAANATQAAIAKVKETAP